MGNRSFHTAYKVLPLFLVSLVTSLTQAAIPPSEFLVKKTTQRRTGFKVLKLQSSVQLALGDSETISLDSTPSVFQIQSLTWVDYTQQTLSYVLSNEAGTVLAEGMKPFESNADAETGAEDESEKKSPPRFGLMGLDHQPHRLTQQLRAVSVPVLKEAELLERAKTEVERNALEKTKMERVDGKPTWAVGVDPQAGRAWFDKETFSLVRVAAPQEQRVLIFNLRWPKWVQDFPFARQWTLDLNALSKSGELTSRGTKDNQIHLIREDFKEVSPLAEIPSQSTPKVKQVLQYTAAGDNLSAEQKASLNRYVTYFR